MQSLALNLEQEWFCRACDEMHGRDGWYFRSDGTRRCRARSRVSSSKSQKKRLGSVREYQRAYRESRQGRVAALQKIRAARHAAKNPLSGLERNRRWRERHPEAQLWRGARDRAAQSGVEFSLTRAWVAERLLRGECELTGIVFRSSKNGRCSPYGPSIDRRDSSLGYTPSNCRVIVWALNMGLSEWGEELYARVAAAYLERRRGS